MRVTWSFAENVSKKCWDPWLIVLSGWLGYSEWGEPGIELIAEY